jgi:hypothetical protein
MAISILLVVLVSLAWIIAGETPGCPLPAKIAAAQVYANRVEAGIEGGWFGWARPGPLDRLAVALAGQVYLSQARGDVRIMESQPSPMRRWLLE